MSVTELATRRMNARLHGVVREALAVGVDVPAGLLAAAEDRT